MASQSHIDWKRKGKAKKKTLNSESCRESAMESLLAKIDQNEVFKLVHLVRSRGLEGKKGTWEQFLKVHDRMYKHLSPCPSSQSPETSIAFLKTLDKEEDVQLLMAWLNSPTRSLRLHYSTKFQKEKFEQRLVRHEHPLEYYLSPHNNPEDRLVTVTGVGVNKSKPVFVTNTEMISLCCDMVLCEDGTEAPIRVVVVDEDFKVILDEFVKPKQPVSDFRTDITGLTSQILDDATFLSLADLHARVIDTSLVFNSEDSGSLENPFLKVCKWCVPGNVSTDAPTLKKPSLNDLCKCILGYDMSSPSNSCLEGAVVAMKLVLSVVEGGTSIPPTKEMLKDARYKRPKIEHGSPNREEQSKRGRSRTMLDDRKETIMKMILNIK